MSLSSIAPLLALGFLVVLLALNADRGFDFTDESYYLLCASSPSRALSPGTQYGYYSGLLFSLTGRNVALFRLAGLGLLLGAGLLFALKTEDFIMPERPQKTTAKGRAGRISVILLGVLVYYAPWMPTPSYNWLNLVSVLLAVTALLAAAGSQSPNSSLPAEKVRTPAGWGCLLGAAVTMAFMSRPYTAAALTGLSLLWTLTALARPRRIVFLTAAAATGTLFFILHVLVFHKNFTGYYQEMKAGLLLNSYFRTYTASRIFSEAQRALRHFPVYFLRMTGLLVPLLLSIKFSNRRLAENSRVHSGLVHLSCLAFWLILWTRGLWRGGQIDAWNTGFAGMSFCLGLFLTKFVFCGQAEVPANAGRRLVPLLLIFASASFAISSENGLIQEMSLGFGLLAAAALSITARIDDGKEEKRVTGFVGLLLTVTVLLIFQGTYRQPYRLKGSLGAQTEPVKLRAARGILKVDPETKRYFDALERVSQSGGWTEQTPLIDLTETPGAAVILNAIAPVTPWLYGKRFPGFTQAALELADAGTLRRAWVLTNPEEFPQSTPDGVLKNLGLNFPEGYEPAVELHDSRRDRRQILWKPKLAQHR